MGQLFSRILIDQFLRLRDGDAFWYQRVFRGDTLQQIESTTLADVIQRNTNVTGLPQNVLLVEPNAFEPEVGTTTAESTLGELPQPGNQPDRHQHHLATVGNQPDRERPRTGGTHQASLFDAIFAQIGASS